MSSVGTGRILDVKGGAPIVVPACDSVFSITDMFEPPGGLSAIPEVVSRVGDIRCSNRFYDCFSHRSEPASFPGSQLVRRELGQPLNLQELLRNQDCLVDARTVNLGRLGELWGTSLFEVCHLVFTEGKSRDKRLLHVDGRSNIFYIPNTSPTAILNPHVLLVDLSWAEDSFWWFDAIMIERCGRELGNPFEFDVVDQVFQRHRFGQTQDAAQGTAAA